MAAYYNEIDKKAAATLRELIKTGVIAPGDVDERSILDVCPDDLRPYGQCHFFAGGGIWSYALRLAGWPDDRPVWTGSCPCQPFSSAGEGTGFDDERHLWPAWYWLIEHGKRPDIPIYGEQVANGGGLAWLDLVQADLEGAGYTSRAFDLCAAGFGAPHIRQRLYFMAKSKHPIGGTECEINGETHWRDGFGWSGNAGELGDPTSARSFPSAQRRIYSGEEGAGSRNAESKRPGNPNILVDTQRTGLEGHGGHGNNGDESRRLDQESQRSVAAAGGIDELGNPSGGGCGERGDEAFARSGGHIDGAGSSSGGVGNSESNERRLANRQNGNKISESFGASENRGASPINGHWRDADWLLCRDGKWRPVEPGTFPLAHGAAERMGRLRLYGNGIVAQVAAHFIKETMTEAA